MTIVKCKSIWESPGEGCRALGERLTCSETPEQANLAGAKVKVSLRATKRDRQRLDHAGSYRNGDFIQSATGSHFAVLSRLQTLEFYVLKDYSSCYGEESTGGNTIV